MSAASTSAIAAALLLTVTACGVPLSDTAEPIPGANRTAAATSEVPAGQVATATVWYVDGRRLVPRAVVAQPPVTASSVLQALAAVPAGSDGLTTLLVDPVAGVPLAAAPAGDRPSEPASDQRIVLSPTFNELTADEQVLLIGQIVLSVTEVDRTPVVFVDAAAAPLSVPLPDGRLRDGPVTRGDYVSLT